MTMIEGQQSVRDLPVTSSKIVNKKMKIMIIIKKKL